MFTADVQYNGIVVLVLFLLQAEDGIRDLVRSRGLGDVYKRQGQVAGEEIHVLAVAHAGCDHHLVRRENFGDVALGLSLIHI